MRHLKLLPSAPARSARIPAALVALIVTACVDQQPTGPELFRLAPNQSAPFSRFFLAWSQNHSSSPIETQTFALDARQERQWAWYVEDNVLHFARANPGRLSIVVVGPDKNCMTPAD